MAMILFLVHYAAFDTTALLITASIIFLVGFELGPGPVFYVLCGEIFPEEARAKCSGIASTMNWIFNIIVVLIFPYFKSIEWAAYALYLALMLPTVIVLWVYTPETKGKTLQEISEIMVGKAEINKDVERPESTRKIQIDA